jgi:hypothetical protein
MTGAANHIPVPANMINFLAKLAGCEPGSLKTPEETFNLICAALFNVKDSVQGAPNLLQALQTPSVTENLTAVLHPLLDVLGDGLSLSPGQLKALKNIGAVVLFQGNWPQTLRYLSDELAYPDPSNVQAKIVSALLKTAAASMNWKIVFASPNALDDCIALATDVFDELTTEDLDRDLLGKLLKASMKLILPHDRLTYDEVSDLAHLVHPRLTGAMLNAVFALQQNDYDGAKELLKVLSVDAMSLNSLTKVSQAGILGSRQAKTMERALKVGQAGRDRLAKIKSKDDMIDHFDADRSGTLDLEEFKKLVAYYKAPHPVSEGQVYRLFVKHKTQDHVPLKKAYVVLAELDNDVQGNLLRMFNLSPGKIAAAIFMLFIFVGINAFTPASNFNSVCNSLLALTGVAGAGQVTSRNVQLLSDNDLEELVERLEHGTMPGVGATESERREAEQA